MSEASKPTSNRGWMHVPLDPPPKGIKPPEMGGLPSVKPERYPEGAVNEAIDALELSYSYLRDKPVLEEKLRFALDLLYRARELERGVSHPYRKAKSGL